MFVGETRGGRTVIGFHNWIQLYLQEKLGHIDYKGYSAIANSPQVSLSLSLSLAFISSKWLMFFQMFTQISHLLSLLFFLSPALSLQPDENKHILGLQFSWKNGIKPKGSIFIGVSPEFEFALYTLCFLTSPNERVKVSFSLYEVEIVCHHYNQKHIGTTYPVLTKYLSR